MATSVLPLAVQGLVNVQIPSRRLSWRRPCAGGRADQRHRARAGRQGVLGDYEAEVLQAGLDGGAGGEPAHRRDGTGPVRRRPVGGRAGRGTARPDRRARRAAARLEGFPVLERYQLRWRAYGVVLSLLLFPLAVNQVLPTAVDVLDGLFFVTTLAIPVVRYRLWAIDTVIRRDRRRSRW